MNRIHLILLAFLLSPLRAWTEIPPERVLQALQEGNQRFLENKSIAHNWQEEKVKKTGTYGQVPSVGVLSCADSRVPVELIFDLGVGDLFVCRNAGAMDSPEVSATFEYGVAALGVHTLLVLGHTKCGAVSATLENKPLPGNIGHLVASLRPAVQKTLKGNPKASAEEILPAAIEETIRYQMDSLLGKSALLQEAHKSGKLRVIGAIYEVETGKVRFLE